MIVVMYRDTVFRQEFGEVISFYTIVPTREPKGV